MWVMSESQRKVRPGMITRIGGFWLSMVRTCTGEVCVRRTMRVPSGFSGRKKRVVHQSRRMFGREVERGEVVEVVFDIRTFGNGKTHLRENLRDLVDRLADRMDAPGRFGPHRQGHVQPFGGKALIEGRAFQFRFAPIDRLGQRIAHRVEHGATRPARFGIERAQRLHLFGDQAFAAQHGDANLVERVETGRARDLGQGLVANLIEVVHGILKTRKRGR